MYTTVKAAAISMKPRKWDKAHNSDKLEALFAEAARQRPDLMVAPEGVLEGYVVSDVINGRRTPEEMLEIAEPIDGPYIARFCRAAQRLGTSLCFGFAELVGREVYNAAVFIDRDGQVRGKYHKAQFAEGTTEAWSFNRIGRSLRAFDTSLGRVGIVICNDRWNPMIVRTLVLDGARLILIPSYGSKSQGQNRTVLGRARENGVPIVEANVGMNLIISKGEIVAYAWGNGRITTAVVDVPAAPSERAARRLEREYLALQGREADCRYRETLKQLKGKENLVAAASRGEQIAGRA